MQDLTGLVRQTVEVCLDVKNGENIWIHSWDHTTDLASDVAFACQERGAHTLITLTTEDYWMRSLIQTPRRLLETLPSHQAAALKQTNAFIFMLGPKNPINWNRIPPRKRKLANVWYLDSNRYLDSWRKIAQKHSIARALESSHGDVDRFGFFGIGLNQRLKHGFTQDDKVSGGVSIGIGGNEDKQGKNRTTGNRHWWASMTHATVQIDKELILKDGSEIFWKGKQ
jgi:leucyl aminopeptidase (aminopeptidase T)